MAPGCQRIRLLDCSHRRIHQAVQIRPLDGQVEAPWRMASQGRGGLEHRYYLEKIKQYYLNNEGFTFIEKDDIDLVVETIHKKMAIQMETGKSDIQAKLTNLGQYKANLKYVLTTNRETEIKIREMIRDLLIPDKENIRVLFVKDFLVNPPQL